jgi:hypothetical protein
MLGSVFRQFAWKSSLGKKYRKLRYNKHIGIREPKPTLPKDDFIRFQGLTSNEVLYNLKFIEHFRPIEVSCALTQLAVRKAPEGNDWNKNPYVTHAIDHCKQSLSNWNPKTLGFICHAVQGLGIKDPEFWTQMEKQLIDRVYLLEYKGLANVIHAFGKMGYGSPEFFEAIEKVSPIAVRRMKSRELMNLTRGLIMADVGMDKLFAQWIYPSIFKQIRTFAPTKLEELRELLAKRSDVTEEQFAQIDEAMEFKQEQTRILNLSRNLY